MSVWSRLRGGAPAASWMLSLWVLSLGVAAPAALVGCGGAQKPADSAAEPPPSTEGGGEGDAAESGDTEGGEAANPAGQPQMGQHHGDANVSSARKLSTIEEAEEEIQASVSALDKLLGDDGATALSSGDGCTRACSAFRSLQRSANALCELAGEDDARCSSARGKVSDNQSRITNAGCSCP